MNKFCLIKKCLVTLRNKGIPYIVTKEYLQLEESKDIDLLIKRAYINKAIEILIKTLKRVGKVELIRYKSLPGVRRVGFFVNKNDSFVFLKFDFIYSLDFKGIKFFESEKYLTKAIVNKDGVCVAPPDLEFLIIIIKELIKGKGKRILNKYGRKLNSILKSPYKSILKKSLAKLFTLNLSNTIIAIFLNPKLTTEKATLERLYKVRKKIIFSVFLKRILEEPIVFAINFVMYYLQMLFFYLKKDGIFIALYGPDGSGKSTLISELIKTNKLFYFSDIKVFHFKPDALTFLIDFFLPKSRIVDSGNPYVVEPYSKVMSLIKVLYYILEYTIGYIFKIRPLLSRESLVVFDRYYLDIVIDRERVRISLPRKFLYYIYLLFIPKPDISFYLDCDSSIIISRKPELSLNRIVLLQNLYKIYLYKEKGLKIVPTFKNSVCESRQKILNFLLHYIKKKIT